MTARFVYASIPFFLVRLFMFLPTSNVFLFRTVITFNDLQDDSSSELPFIWGLVGTFAFLVFLALIVIFLRRVKCRQKRHNEAEHDVKEV